MRSERNTQGVNASSQPIAAAAIGWLLAFTPWVLRSLRIYTTPRLDGRPG